MVSNIVSDRSLYVRYLWHNIWFARYPRAGAHFSPSIPMTRLLHTRFHDSSILPLHYFNLYDLYKFSANLVSFRPRLGELHARLNIQCSACIQLGKSVCLLTCVLACLIPNPL